MRLDDPIYHEPDDMPYRRRAAESKTRLTYWFPLIKAAGLPVPETRIISLSDEDTGALYSLFDGGDPPACFPRIVADIHAAAEDVGGVPFFLRTDFTSGKHDWTETCFVDDLERIGHHIFSLCEFSEMADMFGGMPFDTFVVRELLKTRPLFYAFARMPITREFRFFVRDGTVEHVQPYWPPASIDGHFYGPPEMHYEWQDALATASTMTKMELAVLMALTLRASAAVPGYWSVDWLETVDRGWVLTDMAEGDQSFRWEKGDEPAE